MKIDFEPTLNGGSNLNDIKNNIMKFAGLDKAPEADSKKESGEKPQDKKVEGGAAKKEKKIIIKSFVYQQRNNYGFI